METKDRYTKGFVAGTKAAKKGHSYHPYCSRDLVWAQGFRQAITLYNSWIIKSFSARESEEE